MTHHDSHGDEATVHMVQGPHPHVLPVGLYWFVFFFLVGMTLLTVHLAEYDFGSLSMFVTLLIAGTKAALVAAIFMHLWFDNKFLTLVLSSCLLFLALFILFPIIDLGSRAELDDVKENFLPRNEKVYQYEIDHPNALPLRPGLAEPKKEELIFAKPGEHHDEH